MWTLRRDAPRGKLKLQLHWQHFEDNKVRVTAPSYGGHSIANPLPTTPPCVQGLTMRRTPLGCSSRRSRRKRRKRRRIVMVELLVERLLFVSLPVLQ